ncbi:hypothetical protein CLU79DRAFT_751526 [Phycomyces nitens]|nr:hypothetical protein CLU79DRAFT_751526 [Phycomyces nitens]
MEHYTPIDYPAKNYERIAQDTITTLIVKNVPLSVTASMDQASNYFSQYPTLDIRLMQGPAMRGVAFLDFADRSTAARVYQQLQGLSNGPDTKPLVVEYATPHPKRASQPRANQTVQSTIPVSSISQSVETQPEPIAPSLGLQYPPNPHLCYRYPDPNPEILSNIMHAIGSVPRLYVQVLHLMNKMNLPPPFRPVDRDSIPNLLKRKHNEMLASDESELESDGSSDDEVSRKLIEKKARLRQIAVKEQKKALRRTETKPMTESVEDKDRDTKKIKIVLHNELPVNDQPIKDTEDKRGALRDTFSLDYIHSNRVPSQELKELAAFKNHNPGEISNKLYIKNLAKEVQEDDLERLFGQFVLDNDGKYIPGRLGIQLMKTGRLKGQAFVSFPDPLSAQSALESTHGFLLHDKPIAVKYSKSQA